MSPKSSSTENCAISLPITAQIRYIANQFAARQQTKEKAEQILLNTIAVSIVNNYLDMLGIHTDLAHSDSRNPVMQLCVNVADLEIVGIGKLECRPIIGNANSCHVPSQLPNSLVTLLVEPTRQKVTEQLWHPDGWHILFFAGHSNSDRQKKQAVFVSIDKIV